MTIGRHLTDRPSIARAATTGPSAMIGRGRIVLAAPARRRSREAAKVVRLLIERAGRARMAGGIGSRVISGDPHGSSTLGRRDHPASIRANS
jgi:hypothetical protein